MIRLTRNSAHILKNADRIMIERETDSIDDFWFHVYVSHGLWHHCLCNGDGPIMFSTVAEAIDFLSKRRISIEKIELPK